MPTCICFSCGKSILAASASMRTSVGTFQGYFCPVCAKKFSSTSVLQAEQSLTESKLPSIPNPPMEETTLDEQSPMDPELAKKVKDGQTLLSSMTPASRLLAKMGPFLSTEVVESTGSNYEDTVTTNIESYTPYLKRIIDGLWAMQASFEATTEGIATAGDMLTLIQNLERAHTGLWKFLQEYRSKHTVPAVLPQDDQMEKPETPGLEG